VGDLGRRWRAVAALPTALGRTRAPPSNAGLSGPIEVDVLHDWDGTLPNERDGNRLRGAHARGTRRSGGQSNEAVREQRVVDVCLGR
jgi:hypothetical protein